MRPATELIHAGERRRRRHAADDADLRDDDVRVRQRAGGRRLQRGTLVEVSLLALHATRRSSASKQKLAALDRAESALVFSSGQGATTTILMAHLKAGDEIVCSAAIYGGTLHLLQDLLPHSASRPGSCRSTSWRDPARVFSDRTRIVWFESPINPTLRCVDVAESPMRAARAACCRSSTTRSPARSTSSRWRSASTWRCRARRNT